MITFCQLLNNTFLNFRKRVKLLTGQVKVKIEEGDEEMSSEELGKVKDALTRFGKIDRAVWDEQLAEILTARCNVGSIKKGGRGKRTEDPWKPVWGILSPNRAGST